MPSFKYSSGTKEEQKAREELINKVLPKEPLISKKINDGSFIITRKELTEALIKEIEIYKAFPRAGEYKPDTFNPRNSHDCFMGQGFMANGRGFEGWEDHDLRRYRQAVGTIVHKTWGTCTLMEIWGGDHFEKYPDMVKNVFLYCNGERTTMGKVKFWINPLYANDQSGTWDPHADEQHDKLTGEFMTKVAHFLEIRDRMKKSGVKNPLDLALEEKDDPVKRKRTKF